METHPVEIWVPELLCLYSKINLVYPKLYIQSESILLWNRWLSRVANKKSDTAQRSTCLSCDTRVTRSFRYFYYTPFFLIFPFFFWLSLPKNGLNGFLLFFSRTKCCGSVPCAFIVFVCCRHIIPVRLIFVIFFHSPSGFLPPPSFSASASFPLGQFPAVAF